jgi:hypothetical protein
MSIDDAIKELQEAKARGVKSLVLAYWEASAFDRQDNEDWAYASEWVGDSMDWSAAHAAIISLLCEHKEGELIFKEDEHESEI